MAFFRAGLTATTVTWSALTNALDGGYPVRFGPGIDPAHESAAQSRYRSRDHRCPSGVFQMTPCRYRRARSHFARST